MATIALTGSEGAVGRVIGDALAGPGRSVVPVDDAALASRPGVTEAFASIAAPSGRIDAVVHAHIPSAALGAGRLVDLSDDGWDSRCEAVIRATLHVLQAAHHHLRERGGTIVVVHPTIALVGAPQFAAFATACEAQRGLVKSAARAWGRHGIRVHCVAAAPELCGGDLAERVPGDSPMQPAALRRRPLDSLRHDLGGVVAFLIGDGAEGLTGLTVAVDAGRWMPL